jgi:acyl carrier protein
VVEILDREDVLHRIRQIVANTVGPINIEISESTMASQVEGWDSLTHVQIVVAIESEFNVRLSSSEIAQLENIGSLVDIVCRPKR